MFLISSFCRQPIGSEYLEHDWIRAYVLLDVAMDECIARYARFYKKKMEYNTFHIEWFNRVYMILIVMN